MLYKNTTGQGRPLYLLHGWALNSRVWDGILKDLQSHWQVNVVDLPGHGKSPLPPGGRYDLDALSDMLLPEIVANAVLIGWSLGGILALQLALREPQRISKLVLVASSPQFVRSDDWHHGVDPDVISGFAADLSSNYQQTISRFLAIQAMGSEYAREAIRALREKVFINGEPNMEALRGGLNILLSANLRPQLQNIRCKVQFVLGEKDALIPQSVGAASCALLPHSRYNIIAGAAHAPFITHAQQFLSSVTEFLNE